MRDAGEAAAFDRCEGKGKRRFVLSFHAGRLWPHAARAGVLDLAARAALTLSIAKMLARTMANL